MGNYNYNNLICENYYCQSVSFKPEWLSESAWTIKYKYLSSEINELNKINDELNNTMKLSKRSVDKELFSGTKVKENINELDKLNEQKEKEIKKPYLIEKGILKIKNSLKNNLLFTKKLFINFDDVRNIVIPINFKYKLYNDSKINIYIILSSKNLSENFENNNEKDLILNIDKDSFYVNLILYKKKIFLSNSFEQNINKSNIKSNKIYSFILNIENNFNMLLINETLNNIFDNKYLYNFTFNENKDYYINLYIKTESDLNSKEFIELNFE